MVRRAYVMLLGLLLLLIGSGCHMPTRGTELAQEERDEVPGVSASGGPALDVHEVPSVEPSSAAIPGGRAVPLTAAEVKAILARMPALQTGPTDKKRFAMRPRSLPPPITGARVQSVFPPRQTSSPPPTTASGPLEVLRHGPEGTVELAPELSITFNQPMVPLSSLAVVDRRIPVKLDPEPAGKWHWIGTQTLQFMPTARFPMATTYHVTVPAGTESMTHARLATPVDFSFTTPTVTLAQSVPRGGPIDLHPIVVCVFNQDIDPQAVLAHVQMTGNRTPVPVEAVAGDELKSDRAAHEMAAAAIKKHWVAFRAKQALTPDTHYLVTIDKGTPSAEGPQQTALVQTFDFSTYGPMKVVQTEPVDPTQPSYPWSIEFSNPIDSKTFNKSMVHVSPDVPSLKTSVNGSYLQIQGQTRGRTHYTVTLEPTLPDGFGQTLGSSAPLTFQVGAAPASFRGEGGQFVIVDPKAKPTYSIYSVNEPELKVRMYSVSVSDWVAFMKFMEQYRSDKPLPMPGHLVQSQSIHPDGKPDELTETRLDLAPALKDGLGHVVVMVEPPEQPKNRWEWQQVITWLQVTHIGLDAVADHHQMVAWATRLSDGSPMPAAQVSLDNNFTTASTDTNGLATLPLPDSDRLGHVLVGRNGEDIAFLPHNTSWYSEGGWYRIVDTDSLRWFVFDDRKLYRPAEEVHIKGWLRVQAAGIKGDIQHAPVSSLTYIVFDSRGNHVLKGTGTVDPMGGFSLGFKLPATMNLGSARIELTAVGGNSLGGVSFNHSFDVQEFRRPEFEVTATTSEGPFFLGDRGTATVDAHYYAGGGLPNAEVSWSLSATPGYYAPPNTDGYSFGSWVPWWETSRESAYYEGGYSREVQGHTDGSGKNTIEIGFERSQGPRPLSVSISASVMDVNRQAWSASTSMLVHPARVYVGLKTDKSFVQQGEPVELDTIVTDLDGKRVSGRPVRLHVARLDWTQEDGEYREVEVDPQNQSLTSGSGPVHATFKTSQGGSYRVQATVTDDKGRPNQSDMTIYVAGGKQPPARGVEQQKVTLIPDHKTYAGGDTASVLVQSPFVPAHGLLTLSRSGIIETRPFQMDSASTTLKIPIPAWYVPGVQVQVDLVGAAPRTDDAGHVDEKLRLRPAYASGSIGLSVPPVSRQLKLTVKPQKDALSPGAQTSLDVELTDAKGHPVVGQVALIVVDEAVLALSHYDLDDPMSLFYSDRDAETEAWHSRASVLLSNPEDLLKDNDKATSGHRGYSESGLAVAQAAPAPPPAGAPVVMAKEASVVNPGLAIQVRTNMNALALFAPGVKTDEHGHAHVPFKLPDNLTRYRIMAIAAADDTQFGAGRGSLVARLPLMVRPSAPRFLNFGDRFELPVVVQNQTDTPMTVSLALRATNLQLPDGAGKKVAVPANDRVEVRFAASAVEAGTVRIQVGGVGGGASDAATVTLPCWTPATTEAFAVYGTLDEGGVTQAVTTPPDVFPQFGGLEVTTSSTALASLTDALLYLEAYPFECAEQVSSRVMGVAALRDVLTAFKADGLPTPEAMRDAMSRDIEKLCGLQNYDGGFGFWHKGEESWPYISIHVAHALQVAKSKGFKVPDDVLALSKTYLQNIESHIPSWYGIDCRRALMAYALNVRALTGDVDSAKARQLVDEAGTDHLSIEAQAWLLPVLTGCPDEVAQIRRYMENHVSETAGDAHYTTSYQDGAQVLLASDRRADAIALAALIQDQPKSDLIPKLVHGLLDHRQRGRWENTQENVFVLLALDSYFSHYENVTPDYVARVWLGDQYVGDHTFKGHTTERSEIDIPMDWLASHKGDQNLVLDKTGPGRLYYRLGMSYAPKNLKMPPADYGFTVERRYEPIDRPTDVKQDADGTWHIRAGARVRIHVTMVAQSRRYHVALVDPLPAGLEAMNPELAVTGTVPTNPSQARGPYGWWWTSSWFEHQNLRDERAEAFTSLLWEGVYSYEYVARATTPGTFVVPAARAEEMYHPETFGRSATDRVIVSAP